MGCSPQLTDTIRSRHGRVRSNAARSVVISGSSDRCEANLLCFRPAGVPMSLSARSRGWFAGRSTRGRRAGGLRRRQRATGDDAVPCTADRPLDWGTSWNCPRQGRCRVVLRRRPAASGPHAHALGTGSGAGSSAASNLPGCRVVLTECDPVGLTLFFPHRAPRDGLRPAEAARIPRPGVRRLLGNQGRTCSGPRDRPSWHGMCSGCVHPACQLPVAEQPHGARRRLRCDRLEESPCRRAP